MTLLRPAAARLDSNPRLQHICQQICPCHSRLFGHMVAHPYDEHHLPAGYFERQLLDLAPKLSWLVCPCTWPPRMQLVGGAP